MLFAPEICLGKALVCIGIVVSSESKLLLGFDLMGQKKNLWLTCSLVLNLPILMTGTKARLSDLYDHFCRLLTSPLVSELQCKYRRL